MAQRPPLGTVIETADGSHSIWNGKDFVPAAQNEGGWAVDTAAMQRMGLGSAATKPAAGASAETRTRIALGLNPAIEAQKHLYETEGWGQQQGTPLGKNPLNSFRGMAADVLDGAQDNPGFLAKVVGGQKYQDYNQASKTFESAFLPILSGAAVTTQEAQRLIRAALPQRGDSPETLARKARNRAMMINGAAGQVGQASPFPQVALGRHGALPQAAAPTAPAGPKRIRFDAQGNRIP